VDKLLISIVCYKGEDELVGTHDAFRCALGSFQKAMEGISWLKKAGIEPQFEKIRGQRK